MVNKKGGRDGGVEQERGVEVWSRKRGWNWEKEVGMKLKKT